MTTKIKEGWRPLGGISYQSANMTQEEITLLGEAAAKAALRANSNGNRAGVDQNLGQFVQMMKTALLRIPSELLGDYTKVRAGPRPQRQASQGLPVRL